MQLTSEQKVNYLKRLRFEDSFDTSNSDIKFLETYQLWVKSMWHHHDWNAKSFPTLKDDFLMNVGLCGEAGEVVDVVKKLIRENPLPGSPEHQNLIKKLCLELGDALYYLTMIASRWDITLSQVIEGNVDKLEYRYAPEVRHPIELEDGRKQEIVFKNGKVTEINLRPEQKIS